VRQKELFYGHKPHVSLKAQSGLIKSMTRTPGNAYDGHQLPALLEKDLAQDISVDTVTADRGYDDNDNHVLLAATGIHSAIRLNRSAQTSKMRTRMSGCNWWLRQILSKV
jgi:hypothetical protein